jgi:hypothetical protein
MLDKKCDQDLQGPLRVAFLVVTICRHKRTARPNGKEASVPGMQILKRMLKGIWVCQCVG